MLSALLRGIGRTDKYAVFNFLISLAQILFNVLFIAVFYWGVKGMLLASIVAHFIVPSYYVIKMKLWKYIEFSGLSMKKAKEMVKYSIPLIPNKISWSIINLSDRIIIMNTIGSNASGLYAVSYKFPNLMDTIYGFFYQSWKESSARVANDDSKDAFYNMVYTYLKSIMYSVSILMISFMPLAYYLLINKSYNQAMLYVPILLLGTYFSNVSGFYGGIFTASKDTKIMGTTTIVAAILNLLINILLIYRLGLYAAAISTLVANLVVCIYRKIKVRKYVELEEDYNKTLLAIVVTIIVCSLFYSMKFELQLIGCIVAICYALFSNRKIIMMIFERMKKLQLRSKCCEK